MFALLLLIGCARLDGEACGCPMPGHGALDAEDRCICLPHGPSEPEPEPTTVFEVSPDSPPNWRAIDRALADGTVLVNFAITEWPDRLLVERDDPSEHRLILDGGSGERRAVMPGILTGYDDNVVHRTTVRGFEITGSRDKGVFWNAGDDVILDDLVVHDNRGTPAINLQYSNRTGMPSASFTLRNSHIYNQTGECVYIGGSEGEDLDSHERIVIERNLIHDCLHPNSSKHDGINVKDRIGAVLVRENVVYETDWGIEVASPGTYANNIVLRTKREGFQVSDPFAPIADMHFVDNVVLEPGHDGFHFAAEHAPAGLLSVERASVFGAGEAGYLVAGDFPMHVELTDVAAVANAVGFDGWGDSGASIDGCATAGNEIDADRNLAKPGADCERVKAPAWHRPAGPDNTWFTADDGWVLAGAGAQLPE